MLSLRAKVGMLPPHPSISGRDTSALVLFPGLTAPRKWIAQSNYREYWGAAENWLLTPHYLKTKLGWLSPISLAYGQVQVLSTTTVDLFVHILFYP